MSLTMIVRDEEKNLPHCLESVRGIFDEIVVVDTGSTDRTVEIARSFGARVFDFVWVDDFAAAAMRRWRRPPAIMRSGSMPMTWSSRPSGRSSKRFSSDCEKAKRPRTWCAVRATPAPTGPAATRSSTISGCFRSAKVSAGRTACTSRSCRPCGGPRCPSTGPTLTVRHTGYVDQALRARKLDRDTRILMQELEDRPDDPFTLFNLGAIAVERQEWNDGARVSRAQPGRLGTDRLDRAQALCPDRAGPSDAGRFAGGPPDLCRGLKLDPEDAELWFRKAVVHRHRGESDEAEQCWRRILHCKRPDQFCSVDQGIYGHLTRRNLAALAAERGDHRRDRETVARSAGRMPGDREALAKLNGARPGRSRQPATKPGGSRNSPWIVPGSRRRTVPASRAGRL